MATDKASQQQAADQKRTFAVTSAGHGRWYWVVWPSVVQVREGEVSDHLAEGFASNKLEAIEQALEQAGDHAEWLAAGYARRYYAGRKQRQVTRSVAPQEFLYYDVRVALAGGGKQWRSLLYLILKRTPKYVYVAATPYDASKQQGHWADVNSRMIRLDRASLEKWGYAFVGFGDADQYGLEEPLFYITPYSQRGGDLSTQQDCFAQLELSPPYSVDAVKGAYRRLAKQHHPDRGGAAVHFLALQNAYRQALELLAS
jgi:hypothetical protein